METVGTFLIALIFLLGPPMITSYVIWLVLKKFKAERFSLLRIFFFSNGIWGVIISLVFSLVLHHSEFDGRSLHRVQSGQPMHRRMTNDAPEKVPCDAQR
jgi:hypothetical protein